MKIKYAHLCDYAMVSREGKLSVLGIFTRITSARLPWVHPQAYIAFEIELNYAEVGKEFSVKIELVNADGGRIFGAEAQIMAQGSAKIGQNPGIPQVIGIGGMRFENEGPYNINFWLNGKLEHQLEFTVEVAKGTRPGPPAPPTP